LALIMIFMRYLLLSLALWCGMMVQSQPWMYELSKKKSTGDFNFFEIQEAFNTYWEGKTIEKGKGYKQFRRWEYFMEPRIDSTGRLPYDIINNELLKLFNNQEAAEGMNAQWSFIGPDEVPKEIKSNDAGGAGRINCIAFHPVDSNTIWVGAPSGGVWKTVDGGKTWSTTTDALAAIGVSDIAVNPKNPSVIYLATGDGDFGVVKTYSIGIIKSTDGGNSWQPTGLSQQIASQTAFRKILINPEFPDIMIATSSDGIYGTADGWNNYSKVISGNFKDLEYKPSDYSVIYSTTYDYGGNAKIFKSTDGGLLFSQSMTGMSISGKVNRIELAVTPANPDVIYALCSAASDNGFYALYKSSNSGASWTLIYDDTKVNLLGWRPSGLDKGGQGSYDLSLAVSPISENEIYAGGVNVWRSVNGGKNWKIQGLWYYTGDVEYVHADQHVLIFNPHNDALFSGNDGGIYKTYNKGESWTDLSNGLGILQVYRMAQTELDTGMIIAGSQDNGTVMLKSGKWNEIIGGDGMECFIDYDDVNVIYGTLYHGDIRKSVNGGVSFDTIIPDNSLIGTWITPIVMHPKFPNILYAGYDKVYKTINGGKSWKALSEFQDNGDYLQAIAIAPSNDKILYIATRYDVYKSKDDGKSWIKITSGLPSLYKIAITVAETNPDKVWIVVSGFEAGKKVYQSENGGLTWNNYSAGLPNLPINNIEYQKSSNNGLYIATDIGVYYRNGSMENWEKYGNGLPNVSVYDVKILYSAGKIRAATHGRGIWETDLYHDVTDYYTDFEYSSANVCLNGTVIFDDKSYGNFDSLIWNFGSGATPAVSSGNGPFSVSYSTLGEKSVSLTGYKGAISYTVTKSNIISVDNTVDFIVSPDLPALCKGNNISLYASGGYDVTWYPSKLYDTVSGEKITVSPPENISYNVVAENGACSATKVIDLSVVSNDAICDAILLHEGLNGPYTNFCATPEKNEPVPPPGSTGLFGCESQDGWCYGEEIIDNSLWYKFIAPSGGLVSIETDGFDSQIAVYDASTCNGILTGNYVLLAANDDFPGRADYSAVIAGISRLVPGNMYWLQVDGSFGGVTGTFTIKLNYFRISSDNSTLQVDQGFRFSIYPNPNNGSFTIHYDIDDPSESTVNIYSVTGALVFSDIFYPASENGQQAFHLNNLPSGFYIVEFICNEKALRQKFYVHPDYNRQ
jgi:photosystem II stability/assembly factor-like uncharacterized protein